METLIKSKGKEYICLFDRIDQDLIFRHKWNLVNGYAVATINGKSISMHRLILGVTDPEIQIDHKHHNKLDNRRRKIRLCTRSENRRNSRKLLEGTSKYKGVYRDKNKWHVQIFIGENVKNLGRYRSEKTAAKV
ncbi:MAG: hypothetical protein Q8T08_24690, partial [Ignavibacteria bacterium]|nr:hypothetical protein [Ignavibacteria bacterium]